MRRNREFPNIRRGEGAWGPVRDLLSRKQDAQTVGPLNWARGFSTYLGEPPRQSRTSSGFPGPSASGPGDFRARPPILGSGRKNFGARPQILGAGLADPWAREFSGFPGPLMGPASNFWTGAGPGPKSVRFPHRATPCRTAFFVKLKAGPYSERGRTGGSGGRATPCRAAIGTRPAVGFYAKGGAVGGRRYVGTWGSGTSRF